MLKVESLTKTYGSKTVVRDLSFTLRDHTVVGFVGPNGAGKSTTMNMITGYIDPSAGTIVLDGKRVDEDGLAYRRSLGYLPELPPLYPDMTIEEYLRFVAEVKLKKGADLEAECRRVCEVTDIGHVRGRLIRNMSKGYKQRIGVAQAIIGSPSLIVLDEPTIGLDPAQIVEFRKLLEELKKEHTVLISSHILSEIQEVCSEIIMIKDGCLVANGTQEELICMASGEKAQGSLETDADEVTARELLQKAPGYIDCRKEKDDGSVRRYTYTYDGDRETISGIVEVLSTAGYKVFRIDGRALSMEDAFMRLMEGHGKEAGR